MPYTTHHTSLSFITHDYVLLHLRNSGTLLLDISIKFPSPARRPIKTAEQANIQAYRAYLDYSSGRKAQPAKGAANAALAAYCMADEKSRSLKTDYAMQEGPPPHRELILQFGQLFRKYLPRIRSLEICAPHELDLEAFIESIGGNRPALSLERLVLGVQTYVKPEDFEFNSLPVSFNPSPNLRILELQPTPLYHSLPQLLTTTSLTFDGTQIDEEPILECLFSTIEEAIDQHLVYKGEDSYMDTMTLYTRGLPKPQRTSTQRSGAGRMARKL